MIFNVGSYNTNLDLLENQISEFLNEKFEIINIKSYGAFHTSSGNEKLWYKLFLAYIMNIFIPLRNLFSFRKNKLYFLCKKKF